MALKDIPLGFVLPHRDPDPIDPASVRRVAQRAEALGYRDLWITENVLDHVFSFDPAVVLSYAAAATTTIRVGLSVMVLPLRHPIHVAHQVATLDYLSGGRAVLGVGLGREGHYGEFGIPTARRVRRFNESVELIKALWTQPSVTYEGQIYQVHNAGFQVRPVQQPHPPIWSGAGHPDAVRRAASFADGWMGAGGQGTADFAKSVPLLHDALEKAGRDPTTFPVSKRVFMSVHERAQQARAETERWFGTVYRNPDLTDRNGVYGTPSQVREQLEALVDAGANHLLLNAVARYEEQVEALAEVAGLPH